MSSILDFPFRCPKCDGSSRFPSLSTLKSHLESQHTYRSSFAFQDAVDQSNRFWLEMDKLSTVAESLEEQLDKIKQVEKQRHLEERSLLLKGYRPGDDRFGGSGSASGNVKPPSDGGSVLNLDKVTSDYVNVIEKLRAEVQRKDELLKRASDDLQKLTFERRKLQSNSTKLAKELDDNIEYIGSLKTQLGEKSRQISDKERDVSSLENYVANLSMKETAAKIKLKEYIEKLLFRAEKAEKEVKTMRSLPATPMMQTRESLDGVQRSQSFNTENGPGEFRRGHINQRQPYSSPLKRNRSSRYANGSGDLDETTTAPGGGGHLSSPHAGRAPNRTVGTSSDPHPGSARPHPPGHDSGKGSSGSSHSGWPHGMPAKGLGQPLYVSTPSRDPPTTANGRAATTPGQAHRLKPEQLLLQKVPVPQTGAKGGRATADGTAPGGDRLHPEVTPDSGPHPATRGGSDPGPAESETNTLSSSTLSSDYLTTVSEDTETLTTQPDNSQALINQDKRRRAEALFHIFSYLDTKTLLKIAPVSREWRAISRHPALWRRVTLKNHRISSKLLSNMAKWCTQIHSLSLEGLRPRKIRPKETANHYLEKTRGSLEPGLEELLKVAASTLLAIKICDCSNILTNRVLWLASCHCHCLQSLAYLSDNSPANTEVLYATGCGCRDIVSLQVPPLYPCRKPRVFNNQCLQTIAKCWPLLQALSIGGVEVDLAGLTSIAKTCVKLQVLELDHMVEVTEEMAVGLCRSRLRGLKTLIFTATPVTPKALLHFHSACSQLSQIYVYLSISDYFENTRKKENIQEYKSIMKKLKSLKKKPFFAGMLHIKDDIC